MDVVITIVGKMLEPIIDCLFKSTWRQIGYVVHYKENIKNFEHEVKNLGNCMERIEGQVKGAEDDGMEVEKDVSKWLEEVQRTLTTSEEVTKLLQDKENLCCLDVCSRHQLGREAKKKTMVVTGLKDKGDKFLTFPRVAHPRRLTNIWDSSSTNFEQFESRDSVFKEIMEALKDDGNYKIGIYGMPGVGKTTMVEEVGKQAREVRLFDEVAMAVFSQNPNPITIQEKLAECLNMKLDKKTPEGRAVELCNRMKNGRKILVILDDVWDDKLTLKNIGIPDHSDNSKGCKILLTSRKLVVCRQMGFEKNIEIGLLSEPEAWQLFKRTAGDYIEDDQKMFSVARNVCRECDCLPLAILAVGGALKDVKEKPVWDDALDRLRHFQGDQIEGLKEKLYSRIEWSYNYLNEPNLQSCFLHCCLFPEDAEISIEDDLVRYGMGTGFLQNADTMKQARDRAYTLVRTLQKSYLLLEGRNENFVKMHDVIRDVAISIASKDPNLFMVKDDVKVWPKKADYQCCTTISLTASTNVRRLPEQLDCQRLRTLILRCSSRNCSLDLPNNFFEGMKQLQVLDLYQIKLLPSSLSNLVNLQMLHLCSCKLVDLSFLEKLKNLEILRVVDNLQHERMVLEIPQLTHLRVLDLRDCNENAITFPSGVLSCFSELEELYLPYEFDKWDCEGNARIVDLHSLTRLTTLHICIPDRFILQSKDYLLSFKLLTRYRIFIGNISMFGNFLYSEQFGWYDHKYSKRKILGLAGIPLNVELNFLMENAEVLCFVEMKGLKKVLHDKGESFLDLKYLKVEKCDDMEHLLGKSHGPYPLAYFDKLSLLEVAECRLIKYLFSPSTARGLSNLQMLKIKNCETLEEIVGGHGEVVNNVIFYQLKEMWLEFLPNLKSISSNMEKISLFNKKVSFPVLEKLYIKKLNSITAIWEKKLLRVQKAEDTFEHLQKLNVEDCEKMEELVAFEIGRGEETEANDEIAVFTQLKSMELKRLPSLKSFCIIYGFEKEETSGEGISQVQALFNHKVEFPMLEELELEVCDGLLEDIPSSSLSNVRVLRVSYCSKLVNVLPTLLQRFDSVEQLELSCCSSLEVVVDVFNLEGPNAIERQGFMGFNNLTVIDVCGCDSLRYLFSLSIATTLTQLKRLKIERCSIIEEIVRNEEQGPEEDAASARDEIIILFPRLENLSLWDLPNLRSFCGPNNIAFQLPSLGGVEVFLGAEFGTTRKPVTSFFGNHIHPSLEQYINHWQSIHSGQPREVNFLEHFHWRRPEY